MKDNVAIKIYLLSIKLLEELDNLKNTSAYKQKVKFHTNNLLKEIEKFDKKVFSFGDQDIMMEFVNEKIKGIDKILNE